MYVDNKRFVQALGKDAELPELMELGVLMGSSELVELKDDFVTWVLLEWGLVDV